jgi:N6-adenosine-specific RNA methylase IME4/DNA-binding XRE family transcriptional regulator
VSTKKHQTTDHFGRRLAEIRQSREITQQQLADAIGVSRRVIAYYERESRYPPAGYLSGIADSLACTTDQLLGRSPKHFVYELGRGRNGTAAPTAGVCDEPAPAPAGRGRHKQTQTEAATTQAPLLVEAIEDLRVRTKGKRFGTILADPPWRFENRTGKVAPEHRRLNRYGTMTLEDIMALPISEIAADTSHLYLWVPNALLQEGLQVLRAWGFEYKANLVWHKVRKDGEPDGRGVGFYFRNTTELVLFGVRGKNARTLAPGRRQVNVLKTQKREHSRKPDEMYPIIEACSRAPFLELFARGSRPGWTTWGNQADEYEPTWATYANHSQSKNRRADRDLFQGD